MSGPRAWRVADWGPLGWTETALKTAGMLVGVGAAVAAGSHPADAPSGVRLAEVVVLALLCLGLLAAIADRWAEREVVGMAFVLGMNAGHLAMLAALLRYGGLDAALAWFAGLMLAGDLVKLVFLATTGFRVRSVPPAAVYALTGAYAAGYVALLVMALA